MCHCPPEIEIAEAAEVGERTSQSIAQWWRGAKESFKVNRERDGQRAGK